MLRSIGYDETNWDRLRTALLLELQYVAGSFVRVNLANPPGESWAAHMRIEGPDGSADLVTVWAVNPGDRARLVTL